MKERAYEPVDVANLKLWRPDSGGLFPTFISALTNQFPIEGEPLGLVPRSDKATLITTDYRDLEEDILKGIIFRDKAFPFYTDLDEVPSLDKLKHVVLFDFTDGQGEPVEVLADELPEDGEMRKSLEFYLWKYNNSKLPVWYLILYFEIPEDDVENAYISDYERSLGCLRLDFVVADATREYGSYVGRFDADGNELNPEDDED